MTDKKSRRAVLVTLVMILGVAAAGYALRRSEALPSGPEPVIWDREQCAECRMSVSERAYAAQLQTTDGQVLNFDDPGCLFRYARDAQSAIHAVYYRHVREDRWLAEADAAFIESGPSPMGFNLGAVPAGTAGSRNAAEVRAQSGRAAAAEAGGQDHAH